MPKTSENQMKSILTSEIQLDITKSKSSMVALQQTGSKPLCITCDTTTTTITPNSGNDKNEENNDNNNHNNTGNNNDQQNKKNHHCNSREQKIGVSSVPELVRWKRRTHAVSHLEYDHL